MRNMKEAKGQQLATSKPQLPVRKDTFFLWLLK